jgi:hypothetical protein
MQKVERVCMCPFQGYITNACVLKIACASNNEEVVSSSD